MKRLELIKIIKIGNFAFHLLIASYEEIEKITDEEKLKAIKEVVSKSFENIKISKEDMIEILQRVNSLLYEEGIARYFESLEH